MKCLSQGLWLTIVFLLIAITNPAQAKDQRMLVEQTARGALYNPQKEKKKNQPVPQKPTDGLQDAEIVREDKNENKTDVQTGLYKAKEGESQLRGQFIRIECPVVRKRSAGVLFVIKAKEKLYKFYKSSLANVRLVAFAALPFNGQVRCGMEVKTHVEVIATFRSQTDKNATNDGEVLLIEFIPKDYPTEN